MTGSNFDFSSMTTEERLVLAEALCNDVIQNHSDELTAEQLIEAQHRLAEVHELRSKLT